MREFRPPVQPSAMRIVVAVLLGAVLLVGGVPLVLLATSPAQVSYTLSHGILLVDSGSRMDGDRTIPLALARERRVVQLRGARRTRGTAIPGYCTGRWAYADIGAVWQATDCSGRGVLLVVAGEDLPVVVTPPDPEGFLRQLDAGADMRVVLPAGDPSLLRALPGGAVVLLLLVGGMGLATLLLGPGRMRYLVGDGRLRVNTIFSRRDWATQGMHARPHTPRVTLRVAGTAVRGYYTGWFRADGKTTRVYATDLAAGVLIDGPARVFLSPEDRAGFLAALGAEGATIDEAPRSG